MDSIFATKFPIISDLAAASWSNWREAIREVVVVLFFSLMPVWLGLLLVTILNVPDNAVGFLYRFASNSDLGILSTALLGPLLYLMFCEGGEDGGLPIIARFPSGIWYMIIIIGCCVVATVIYCFYYLSTVGNYFDSTGGRITFVDAHSVAILSWVLFSVSTSLVLCAATIRNSLQTRSPGLMREDTADYVEQLRATEEDEA